MHKGVPTWRRLRSSGSNSKRAADVGDDGTIYTNGSSVDYIGKGGGVRPAMWVKLQKNNKRRRK